MRLLEELVKNGKISQLQSRAIAALDLEDEDNDDRLVEALVKYGLTKLDILNARASAFNLGTLDGFEAEISVSDKLSEEYVIENKVIPIKNENGSLVIGVVDPEYNNIINKLKLEMLKIGAPYKINVISQADFDRAFKKLYIDNIQKKNISTPSLLKVEMTTDLSANVGSGPSVPTAIATDSVAEKIKQAQEMAVKTTKEEEGVTFAGLVNKAMSTEENNVNVTEENQKAREELLSEDDLLDITDNDGDLQRLQNDGDGSAVDEINTILKYAIDGSASDIHIEHAGEYTRVRIRVDGELREIAAFGKSMHPMIVARIKILSGLRMDEKRKPQDGRFSALLNFHKIDFRVSTMPGYYGEKIVMRILDSYRGIKKLEEIGFSSIHLQQIRDALRKPYGMVLISGPTGSGKTTTLYSMLNEIDRKSKNVVSLEDPIEYNVQGMNQSQVFPEIGYTFASGLRSILRQDPDVIMVGEIRDAETAQLAVQAALTGHLVFSTIHTNNSVGVITRLIDMDVDPFLIAPTLNLAIAQRLVKHIVDGAEDPILDNPGIEKIIETQFADLPDQYKVGLNLKRPVHNPKSTADNPTGMKGRVPVLEILEIDKDVQRAIINKETEENIWKIARSKGMISMKEDAIMKSMEGKVPFVEISNL